MRDASSRASAPLLNVAATFAIALGRCDLAEKYWRTAIQVQPDHAVAHSNLGILLQELKRFAESEAAFRLAIALRPEDAEVQWNFSLPLYFHTTIETIPATLPYLAADPQRIEHWHHRLPASGLSVGLVWKGFGGHKNDANRSLPGLSALAPLWGVPGVSFVSLQKGQGENEALQPSAGQPLLNLGAYIRDFADTAAIVAQIDLVICVDTAIAHLAGALGKPCWVVLPAVGTDWRWMHERTDSPWYPGVMRLFRQKTPDDWSDVMAEVAG